MGEWIQKGMGMEIDQRKRGHEFEIKYGGEGLEVLKKQKKK